MSIISILVSLFEYLINSASWFVKYESPRVSYGIAMNVIETAKKLQKTIDDENTILVEKGADASFDGDLTICLPRHDETGKIVREYHTFPEFDTKVHRTQLDKTRHSETLKDPADEKGYRYYIYATPMSFGVSGYFIQLTKKEADYLLVRIPEVIADFHMYLTPS